MNSHELSPKEIHLVEITKSVGKKMYLGLLNVFEHLKFDPSLISSRPVICNDVEYAPEAVALKDWSPGLLILTEGYCWDQAVGIIQEITKGLNSVAVNGTYYDSFPHLKENKAILATRLNIYPDDIEPDVFLNYIQHMAPHLLPNGLILLSIGEEEYRPLLQSLTQTNLIPGVQIDMFDKEDNISVAAGNIFVAARKK